MSDTVLAIGSVVVIAAIIAALAIYLHVIGSAVQHIAETLEEKVAPGAREVRAHTAAITPAAVGLRRGLGLLGRPRRTGDDDATHR